MFIQGPLCLPDCSGKWTSTPLDHYCYFSCPLWRGYATPTDSSSACQICGSDELATDYGCIDEQACTSGFILGRGCYVDCPSGTLKENSTHCRFPTELSDCSLELPYFTHLGDYDSNQYYNLCKRWKPLGMYQIVIQEEETNEYDFQCTNGFTIDGLCYKYSSRSCGNLISESNS